MRNVSTLHFILGVLIKYLINIIQGVQFVGLENKIFVIDISEPKQSHKVNEISQMIINDPINTHISDMKIIIIKQSLSSNFVKLQP